MQYRLSTIFLVFFVVAASLASFGIAGFWVCGIALGLALLVYWRRRLKFTLVELLVVISIIGVLIGLLLPAVQTSGSRRSWYCTDHLRQIGLALHNYREDHRRFPPVCVTDKNGKPLYSWMVEILPYMERQDVYDQLKRDEPWDSPRNAAILGHLRIDEFECRKVQREEDDFSANYMAIVGPGTIWWSDALANGANERDPSLTVAAVECATSDKHWAEPYVITADEALERMKTGEGVRVSTRHEGFARVLFADGYVRAVDAKMPISRWRRLLMGEMKSLDELEDWRPNPDGPAPMRLWLDEPPPPPDKWPIVLSVFVWLTALALLFYRAWRTNPIPAVKNDDKTDDVAGGT
jgi:prepilin-type N-terminal cleavage/methylation domain-containing protein